MIGPKLQAAYEARDALSGRADDIARESDGRDACRWSQCQLRRRAKWLRRERRSADADALLAYADARLDIWRAWRLEGGKHSKPPSDVKTNGTTPWYEGARWAEPSDPESRRLVPPWVC